MEPLRAELESYKADLTEFVNIALVAPDGTVGLRRDQLRFVSMRMLDATKQVIAVLDEQDSDPRGAPHNETQGDDQSNSGLPPL